MPPATSNALLKGYDLELTDEHLVRYWSARLHCTPAELFAVVARVGRSVARVQEEATRRAGFRHVD